MNLLVFWNELAEQPPAVDRLAARVRMNTLVDALAALRRAQPATPPRLRSYVPLHGVELADGYTVANWQIEADPTRRLFFLQLAASSPLLRSTDDPADILDRYGCSDCRHQGVPAAGLRAAWAADDLAVSLESNAIWRHPSLNVDVDVLDESGQIERRTDVVRHLSQSLHVGMHQSWLKERQLHEVKDGHDLWDRRADLFPNLYFCRELQQQLRSFDPGSDELRNVVRRLVEMDAAFARWDGLPLHGAFLPSKCTPETPQTLKEEAEDHTGTLPDGQARVFSWHVRFTPGQGRIFFDGDAAQRRGVVGYVGIKKGGKLT